MATRLLAGPDPLGLQVLISDEQLGVPRYTGPEDVAVPCFVGVAQHQTRDRFAGRRVRHVAWADRSLACARRGDRRTLGERAHVGWSPDLEEARWTSKP